MACEAQHSHFLGESIANCASHACGGAAILLASPSLLAAAHARGGTWGVGASIFIATALLLPASTLYHAAVGGGTRVLQRDHCAIFLLIAGTYTPFPWACSVVRGDGACSARVGLAVTGVARNPAKRRYSGSRLGSTWPWVGSLIAAQAVASRPPPGLLLLDGGVAYTLGTIFYVCDQRPYSTSRGTLRSRGHNTPLLCGETMRHDIPPADRSIHPRATNSSRGQHP